MRRLVLIPLVATLICGSRTLGPDDFSRGFDRFWETLDRTYPYFGVKGVDWDALRAEFRPQVAAVQDATELVALLAKLAAPLRDVHVFFTSPTGRHVPTYTPVAFVNWDLDVWRASLAGAGWTQVAPNLGYARIAGVPYILMAAWNRDQFTAAQVDGILERFRAAPGLILDVRPNGGGSDELALDVAGRFTASSVVVESYQFRDGRNHDDFGNPVLRTLRPRGPWTFAGRVVVLSGRGVYSSNETFIAAMRELPNVTIMGDTTGGATGNPGRHDLLEGWRFSTSRWLARTADGIVIEGQGIPPDVHVPATPEDRVARRDPVLDRARALIDEP
ncbi:MAG: S41 family peptidase [Gemmatimonadales bacterium]